MNSFFANLDFSLPTALAAQYIELAYEGCYFEVETFTHKNNPLKPAEYIAEYMKFTDKPISNKVKDIIEPHKLKKSSNAVFYCNDKGEYRGFNFR